MKNMLLFVSLLVLVTACSTQGGETGPDVSDEGMTARHQAEIPAGYAGLTNPIPSDEESLARGAELYATNCASCHGNDGMGDGPAASALNPPPAPLAHTSQTVGDDYLFWRISEARLYPNDTCEKARSERGKWKPA